MRAEGRAEGRRQGIEGGRGRRRREEGGRRGRKGEEEEVGCAEEKEKRRKRYQSGPEFKVQTRIVRPGQPQVCGNQGGLSPPWP